VTCKIIKAGRSHWLDQERRCSTHRVAWHLPWSGEKEGREWKGPREEPTRCPLALLSDMATLSGEMRTHAILAERDRVLGVIESEIDKDADLNSFRVRQIVRRIREGTL
jgi:hypothetical protein